MYNKSIILTHCRKCGIMNMNDVNEVIKLLDGHYPVKPLARSRMNPEPEPSPTEIHNVMRDHIYQDAGNQAIFQQALKILLSGNRDFLVCQNNVILCSIYYNIVLLLDFDMLVMIYL